MQAPEALRAHIEGYLATLSLTPELGKQSESVRYALARGKRVRAQVCLATAEAGGGTVEDALPAAAALELVQAFSLVHDDLPALDNDVQRRGQPSVWARFGEPVAILAGDALLAEAFRQASSYENSAVVRELAEATLGMIGGQYLDITGGDEDLVKLHRLKTGRLLAASVGLGLWSAAVPEGEQGPWRAFAEELGPLFQIMDDILDGDGYAVRLGDAAARGLAAQAAGRAAERLAAIDADTSVLRLLVDELATRTA